MDTAIFMKKRTLSMVAALIICICAGVGYAWSVLQTPIIAAHHWPDKQVSLTYTITVLCSTMAPLLFGSVIRKLSTRTAVTLGAVLFGAGLFLTGWMGSGVWQLYLFYGVLSGLGTGFIYPTLMAYVVRLYPDRSGMASGLGTAAYGSGAIFWAPVAAALIEGSSLRTAFSVLGAGFFVIILAGTLLLREPPENLRQMLHVSSDAKVEDAHGINLRRSEMVKTLPFYMMVLIFTCGLVAGVIVISQASPILQSGYGFTAPRAAVFVSVFAACNMAGRFLWGSLSDKMGIRSVMIAVFALCICSMTVLAQANNTVVAILAMAVAASCYGGFASVLTPLTAKVFGAKYVTENYGVMYIVFGLASLIGPVLAVQLKNEATGSYTGAFIAAGVLALLGLIGTIAVKLRVKKEDCNEQ